MNMPESHNTSDAKRLKTARNRIDARALGLTIEGCLTFTDEIFSERKSFEIPETFIHNLNSNEINEKRDGLNLWSRQNAASSPV